MNNSDMPAMPQTWVPDYGNKPPVVAGGLTKREHFAAMLPPFEITFSGNEDIGIFLGRELNNDTPAEEMIQACIDLEAKVRVMRADAHLAALEKKA